MYREICSRCNRATSVCLCAWITPVATSIRFVFLVHRDEWRNRNGTIHLLRAIFPSADVWMGSGTDLESKVSARVASDSGRMAILYPRPNAFVLNEDSATGQGTREAYRAWCERECTPSRKSSHTLTLFVLDGTWATAKKLWRDTPSLHPLPALSLKTKYESGYQFRKQPAPECLSSLEAVAETLTQLERLGESTGTDPNSIAQILRPFRALVKMQLLCAHYGKATQIADVDSPLDLSAPSASRLRTWGDRRFQSRS